MNISGVINKYNSNTTFNGTTKIYAMSDTHQEARKTATLLSNIFEENQTNDNVLLLHAGDMGKGVYPAQLEVDSYIKLKKMKPDIEIVMTTGNNDFGFNSKGFKLFAEMIKRYTQNGIKIVCANIFDRNGKRPQDIQPYTIIERDGDRNFITGFCIDKIEQPIENGLISKNQTEIIEEIINAIKEEKPDNVIILNHDFRAVSKKIIKYCQENGINIDLLIEGHDHGFLTPDRNLNIYHPEAYSKSMYKMELENNNEEKKLKNIEIVNSQNIIPNDNLIKNVEEYEYNSGLLEPVCRRTLNLTKYYGKPSSLGSFLADSMKDKSNADIGFCSTGLIVQSLEYEKDKKITNYDIKKAISGETLLQTVELSAHDIKKVFECALNGTGYNYTNPNFLQCSSNIRITGKNNRYKKHFEIKQIYINNKPLFDNLGNPLNNDKKYKCAVDSYIANECSQFKPLLQAEKTDVKLNGSLVKLYDVLLKSLCNAENKYQEGAEYPHFIIEEL